jgi:hypothetical protein
MHTTKFLEIKTKKKTKQSWTGLCLKDDEITCWIYKQQTRKNMPLLFKSKTKRSTP